MKTSTGSGPGFEGYKGTSTLLLVFGALLLSLSFHPLNLHFLAWFGLIPVLYAIEGATPGAAFRSGILFGFVLSLFTLFWIVFVQIEANIKLLIVFGLILMYLYIGLYFGVAFLVRQKVGIWALPLALVGLEYVRGIGEIGFPWLSFGYTQARYPLFVQQAAIYGVYGVSFWLVALNVAFYQALKNRRLPDLVVAAVIFLAPVVYGSTRGEPAATRIAHVGIVQPNIDPNLKFSREMRFKTFERLIDLSVGCARRSVQTYGDSLDLIIWPETATPVFLRSPGKYQDLVRQLADRLGVPIFTGTAIYEPSQDEIYNGAVLIEPGRGITQEYRKMQLVPFSERMPFNRHIPLLRKVDVGGGDYAPGTEHVVLRVPRFTFACLICFESIFPGLSRTSVNLGAEVLVNITNDGWFGKVSGAQQHNNMAILRSVENGVALLRSANTGISMVVDQHGRVIAETELFVDDAIVAAQAVDPVETPYRRIGDIVPIICLIATTILLARNHFKAREHDSRYRIQDTG